jgi:hypothetical protein
MRDDEPSGEITRPLPLAVMVQPDPMLEEHRAGPFRIIATAVGAAVIVGLALYGMTRPPEPQQTAAAPSETQTAPAGGGAQQPTTTGQGSSDKGSGGTGSGDKGSGEPAGQPETTGQGQPKGEAAPANTPPASGGSATSAVGPGAKPAPEAR